MNEHSGSMSKAVDQLAEGNAAIFPTETVYGLGVAVEKAASPDVLYNLKERDERKPVAWLVGSRDDLGIYGKCVPEFARVLARAFWPGPLTLIVKASDRVPGSFRSNEDTIGLRMPNNETALELIAGVGCPLATTSANLSGRKPPRSFDSIDPLLVERVGVALPDSQDDDKSGLASTVLDCTGDHPVVVRQGSVTIAAIQALA